MLRTALNDIITQLEKIKITRLFKPTVIPMPMIGKSYSTTKYLMLIRPPCYVTESYDVKDVRLSDVGREGEL